MPERVRDQKVKGDCGPLFKCRRMVNSSSLFYKACHACEGENDGASVAVLLPNVCDEHSGAAEATVHGPENVPGGFSGGVTSPR